jgi:hypothetical protein
MTENLHEAYVDALVAELLKHLKYTNDYSFTYTVTLPI